MPADDILAPTEPKPKRSNWREWRALNLERGLCGACGRTRDVERLNNCSGCNELHNQRCRSLRAERKAANLCQRCGTPIPAGFRSTNYCPAHLADSLKRWAESRKRKREARERREALQG